MQRIRNALLAVRTAPGWIACARGRPRKRHNPSRSRWSASATTCSPRWPCRAGSSGGRRTTHPWDGGGKAGARTASRKGSEPYRRVSDEELEAIVRNGLSPDDLAELDRLGAEAEALLAKNGGRLPARPVAPAIVPPRPKGGVTYHEIVEDSRVAVAALKAALAKSEEQPMPLAPPGPAETGGSARSAEQPHAKSIAPGFVLGPGTPDPTKTGVTYYTVPPEQRDGIIAALNAEARAKLEEQPHAKESAHAAEPPLRRPHPAR